MRRQFFSLDHKGSVLLIKNITIPLVLTMFLANSFVTVEANPILPTQYQKLIGPGFATNCFKTPVPMRKYSEQNIIHVRAKNFTNLRLRCRADLYSYNYTATNFTWFLGNLTTVVDHRLQHNVIPIISWIHHHAEAYASEDDDEAYVRWWTAVTQQLKDKDYKLSFNLFTELGVDICQKPSTNCSESLRERTDKYNRWTATAVDAIRKSRGKNAERILILGSPKKTARGLNQISESIYRNDSYMMAEWHIYASGPNKKPGRPEYWNGDGIPEGRQNVRNAIQEATTFTEDTGLLTYLGAWMPQDNEYGNLTEEEVINFARFFVGELCNVSVPWSLNVLDRYYHTRRARWLTENQTIKDRSLNMSRVLDNIREVMPKDSKCCPFGWVRGGNSCYYVDDTSTPNQSDARQTCQSKGGDLAIIRSAQENDFILDLLMKQTTVNENGTWIGLQKDDAGSLFYWTDGTPLAGQYQNWDTGKPDNAGGQEKCGNMWGSGSLGTPGKWNDSPCENSGAALALCQKPAIS